MQSPSSLVDPSNVVVSLADALLNASPIGHVVFVMLRQVASFLYCPAEQLEIQHRPLMRMLWKEQGGAVVALAVVVLQPKVLQL